MMTGLAAGAVGQDSVFEYTGWCASFTQNVISGENMNNNQNRGTLDTEHC